MQFGLGVHGGAENIEATLRQLADDPLAAAASLDALADDLHTRARLIREATQQQAHGFKSQGGMGDRARLAVVGPDGNVRRTTDTEHRP